MNGSALALHRRTLLGAKAAVKTFVQAGNTGVGNTIASGSAGSVLTGNSTIGNCVAVAIIGAGGANVVVSVTSTIGTFTKVVSTVGITDIEFWVCLAATGAASTVTVTTTGAVVWQGQATEWSGGVSAAASGGVGTGSSTAPSLTVTPSGAGNVVLVLTDNGAESAGPGGAWTDYNTGQFALSTGRDIAWQVVPSTAAVTATWTTGVSGAWTALGCILS